MRKQYLTLAVAVLVMALLPGCCLVHQWQEATCIASKVCAECGETEGEALGHTWADADCVTAKACSVCGATEGEALGHIWAEADCVTAKTCTTCGETEGEVLGHESQIIGLRADGYDSFCKRCEETEAVPVDDWATAAQELIDGEWYMDTLREGIDLYSIESAEWKTSSSLSFDSEMGTVTMSLGYFGDFLVEADILEQNIPEMMGTYQFAKLHEREAGVALEYRTEGDLVSNLFIVALSNHPREENGQNFLYVLVPITRSYDTYWNIAQ